MVELVQDTDLEDKVLELELEGNVATCGLRIELRSRELIMPA